MKITDIAFHQKLGIQVSEKTGYLLSLPFSESNRNHLNTFHATAIFGLAEISSGLFLQNEFTEIADKVMPVMRAANVKFKKPATSAIYSSAQFKNVIKTEFIAELEMKKRALITVEIKISDEDNHLIFIGEYEWFVMMG
jgi:acyl-coenzyme A thioesterase PaaI-like protein